MKPTLSLLASLVVLAVSLPAGIALAQAAPASKADQQRAAAEARQARRDCQRLDDGQKKRACLRDVRAKQAQARKKDRRADAAAKTPAVQTQSAEVGATGAAPVAVDQRTPARPASAAR